MSMVFPAMQRFTAVLAALATAVTLTAASAVPARADDDAAKILGALATVAIIGAIVNDNDNNRHRASRGPVLPQRCAIQVRRNGRNGVVYSERCLNRAGFDYRLPGRCATEVRYDGRRDRVYGGGCLRDAGFRLRRNR